MLNLRINDFLAQLNTVLKTLMQENAQLTKENAELKKATNPQTIAEIVKKQVALALHGQGLDNSDPGVGEMPDDNDALERDIAALNAGQMRAAKFAQKWGR